MARPDITELGESLLSGKIERVRKQEKRAEKDQRKALLMGLGLQLGAGVVNNYFKNKYNAFLKDERILQSKARINSIQASAEEWKSINDRIIATDKTRADYFIEQDFQALKDKHSWDDASVKKMGNNAARTKQLQEWYEQAKISGVEKATAFEKAGIELQDVMSGKSFDELVILSNDKPSNMGAALLKGFKAMTGRGPKKSEEQVLNELYQKGFIEAEEFSVAMSHFKKSGSLAAAVKATELLPSNDEIHSVTQQIVGDRLVTTTEYYDAETQTDKKDVQYAALDDAKGIRESSRMITENLVRETVKNTFNDTGRKAWAKWNAENSAAEKSPQEIATALYSLMQDDKNIDTKVISDTQLFNSLFANVIAAQTKVWEMEPGLRAGEMKIIVEAFRQRNLDTLEKLKSMIEVTGSGGSLNRITSASGSGSGSYTPDSDIEYINQ